MVKTYRRRARKHGKSRLRKLVKVTESDLGKLLKKVHLKKPSTKFFKSISVKGGKRSIRRTRRTRCSRRH